MNKITQLVSEFPVVSIAVFALLVGCSSNPETPLSEQSQASAATAPVAEGKQFPPVENSDAEAGSEVAPPADAVAAAPESTDSTESAPPPPLPPPSPTGPPAAAQAQPAPKAKMKGNPKSIPGVLEEVTDADALGATGAAAGSLAGTPEYQKLKKKLGELGYEGVGLEHEPASVLNLLYSVFSHPDAAKRKIKRVYTGGSMEYDARAEAVTVGGLKTKAKILMFFRKKIPKR